MTRHLATFTALLLGSGSALAHDHLVLDGTLHRALHAIGSERLVMFGGIALAVVVGWAVRRAVRRRDAARREG
ncbi:MAG: hypothetical protein H6977_02415 [Gammaproteobacteria bacterium]|nr:hypothetical protein [Gammaproteobacteria bacterium]MCP5198838.1 hypothetical protein [Gammaproteobacteria bacterium]